jgi:spermidine/putrescine transport system ATP-binding protein
MQQPAQGTQLRLVGLTKRFGSVTAVDGLDLTVEPGSFLAFLGPSGCGKTTTLRMIAGLERPTSGGVFLGDVDVTDLKPYRRPVNTVFQNYALFPHLDINGNVAFGLHRSGIRGAEAQRRVDEMLELMQLSGYGRRRVTQLSGGQQQRVALARALVNHPKMLLLDEPLGALDLKLRKQMQIELKRIQTEVRITFVHVTHDQEEAMTMADTIAVMNEGRIEQLGSPVELYERPRTAFVANFLGQSNLLSGQVVGTDAGLAVLAVGDARVRVPAGLVPAGGAAQVGVRPEKLRLLPAGEAAPGHNVVEGTVVDRSFTGVSTQFLVRTGWGQELAVFLQNAGTAGLPEPGDHARLAWDPRHTFVLEERPVEPEAALVAG